MDSEVTDFMRGTIKSKKQTLIDVITEVADHFKAELHASDVSFIQQKFRLIVAELWAEECIEKLRAIIDANTLEDDQVIELLGIFQAVDAFEKTPINLRADFYNLIVKEFKVFNSRDFTAPRKEISDFLAMKILNFGQQTRNEYEFYLSLLEVLRNAYRQLDAVAQALKLQDFISNRITVYQVSRNVISYNFTIDHYKNLKKIASKVKNHNSSIKSTLQKGIQEYLKKLSIVEISNGVKTILKLQNKLMTSTDLNVIGHDTFNEVHINCDILHVDGDLPIKYRGKNIFVVSNTIRIHKKSTWDISGHDSAQRFSSEAGRLSNGDGMTGENGSPGESGGNCEIFAKSINNSNFWTIKAIGGKGSRGQNGGNGINGTNGRDITAYDFKLLGQQVTSSNFTNLLDQMGISTADGSRRMSFYENGLEKILVFNRNSSMSELLMLIKSSCGTIGALGGFPGFGGRGGFAGKVHVICDDKSVKIIAKDGLNGQDGLFGYNGITGRDGRDAYMKVTSYSEPKYGGLNQMSKFEIKTSTSGMVDSIYYQKFQSYLTVNEVTKVLEDTNPVMNSMYIHKARLQNDQQKFFNALIFVLRNSNEKFSDFVSKSKLRDFLDQRMNLKSFASELTKTSFDISGYDTLKSYATFFDVRTTIIDAHLRDLLRDFVTDAQITVKAGKVCELKKKLVTSADIDKITQSFLELHIICDTLHVNSPLRGKFGGRSIAVVANIVHIHANVTWNLSGCDNFLALKQQCNATDCYEHGGYLIIDGTVISNSSLLKVIVNGGNASDAENGIDVNRSDLNINVYSQPQGSTFVDGKLQKHIVKQSNSTYLLLVKGTKGTKYDGAGAKGGQKGSVEIRSESINEIEVVAENGKDDITRDGRDAFVYVEDGDSNYYGLDLRNKYDITTSWNSYFPKLARELNDIAGPDDVELYENLIWVLRNSHDKFQAVVNALELKKFTDGRISLNDVALRIAPRNQPTNFCGKSTTINNYYPSGSSSNFDIANFSNLKNCAKNFSNRNLKNEQEIRSKLKEFLQPADKSYRSKVITVKKKILNSSDFSSLIANDSVEEVRIICDTLHIDSELPQSFRGKNLAILASYVQVHDKTVTWDLSGAEVSNRNYISDAGQNSSGEGLDGKDGIAGKSGGNFSLKCKVMENLSALTVISNGSNGGNGQNGGNGRDGEDGKDAQSSSFRKNGVEWDMSTVVWNKVKMREAFDFDGYKTNCVTHDGLVAHAFAQYEFFEDFGLMLVKGSDGQSGKQGGAAGLGGQGGIGGKISIKVAEKEIVKKTGNNGRDGNPGIQGLNGAKGRDGGDMWKFDQRNWSSQEVHGEGSRVKYKLVWNGNCARCVYDYTTEQYVHVAHDYSIVHTSTRQRNESKVKKNRSQFAMAKKNSSIDMDEIRREFSQYLNKSELNTKADMTSRTSSAVISLGSFRNSVTEMKNMSLSYLQLNSHELWKVDVETALRNQQANILEATKKSDILIDMTFDQYSDFIKMSQNELDELTKKYRDIKLEIVIEDVAVQTSVKVQNKFEVANRTKSVQIDDVSERTLYYRILRMLLDGCDSSDLFSTIQAGRFDAEKYKYLADNVSAYNVKISLRNYENNIELSSNVVERFIMETGVNSKDPDVSKYYELYTKNDPSWKNCYKDLGVLEVFYKSQPAFLVDIFKNSIEGSRIDIEDLEQLCEEKFLLKFYKEIYRTTMKNRVKSSKYNFSPFDKIPFFKDTQKFSSYSESFEKHFLKNGDEESAEIWEFFQKNSHNFNTSLPEAIFNLLNAFADELDEIKGIIKEFKSNFDGIFDGDSDDEVEVEFSDVKGDDTMKPVPSVLSIMGNTRRIELEPKKLFNRNIKKEKFTELLSNFFNNEKVMQFIKDTIQKYRIGTSLYRRILAHKYNLELTIFARNIDGDLKIVERHNRSKDLAFEYYDKNDEWDDFFMKDSKVDRKTTSKMFLLLKDQEYSILEFEAAKYEAFKTNMELDHQFEVILSILNGQNVSDEMSKSILQYIAPIMKKFGTDKNKLLEVFNDNGNCVDNNVLVDIIVSNFPYVLVTYDENGANETKIDEKFKVPQITSEFIIKDDEDIRESIRSDLLSIAGLNGLPILKAIAICFFVNKNPQNLHDFSLLLKTILSLMKGKCSLKHLITFMILSNEQEYWPLELALLKLDSIYGCFDEKSKEKWRHRSYKTKAKKLLDLLLEKVAELDDADEIVDSKDVDEIMDNMQYFDKDNYENLKNSSLSTWKLMTTEKYWTSELSKLELENTKNLNVMFEDLHSKYGSYAKEVLKILQDKPQKDVQEFELNGFIQNCRTGEWQLNDEIIGILKEKDVKSWSKELATHYQSNNEVRKAPQIVRLVESDKATSESIQKNIKSIGDQAQSIFSLICPVRSKKFMDFTRNEVKDWIKNGSKSSVLDCLAIVTRAMQIITFEKNQKAITLRDTQLISILTMWNSNNGVLMQVSTGEGKTFIGVSFAILKVLQGQKIDIITSSSVLAERDADENRDFFSFFDISVDHNCYDDKERRKKAYESQVVYGILGNFQRDYLLTEFYEDNFMSGHHFDNVLVDEVDSMLLDKGNNILYLSSDLPDIDEVESVFVFIWQYVCQRTDDPNEENKRLDIKVVRNVVLDNTYGVLDEDDIKQMNPAVDANKIIHNLRNIMIIDEENLIHHELYSETLVNAALSDIDESNREKINFFIKSKIDAPKSVKVPKYLLKFVKLHLNKWIESAIRAMALSSDSEYVVDRQKSSFEKSVDPSIIILDLDTGTDMTNSQWDEGLHQFLQLKHGCKLSLISLKSVFISNVSYFKKYKILYGMTGTLGSAEERKKTTEMHAIDFVTLPRFVYRRFTEYPTVLEKDVNSWLKKIHDEVVSMFEQNRSVLIICETIQDTKMIYKVLIQNAQMFSSHENVHMIQRDTTEVKLGKLKKKHVVIATNLAGRGTDIKLSNQLKEAGGLHVILAYMPQNERIENQALGRASRAGDKGSGRLIVYTEANESIATYKVQRNQGELKRLNDVIKYYKNFITIEEKFFKEFHAAFRELKDIGNTSVAKENWNKFESFFTQNYPTGPKVLSESFMKNYSGFQDARGTSAINIYLENFKLQWSFWLDENSVHLDNWKESNSKDLIERKFRGFLTQAPVIHPVKILELFKYHSSEKDIDKAKSILTKNFQADSVGFQFYYCYAILKKAQESNSYKNRRLATDEKRELMKCLKMLKERCNNRNVRWQMIESMKQEYENSLVSIEAYKNQQTSLNEIDEMFIDSVQSILGYGVTPETVRTTEVKNEITTKTLYDLLINNDCVSMVNVSDVYEDNDIKSIAASHSIKFEELKRFLNQKRSSYITSMKNFGEDLKRSIKFPSRVEFWEELVKNGILTDEIEYAIIDLNAIKDVDPSFLEEVSKFQNLTLDVELNSQIYFSTVNAVNGNEKQLKVTMQSLKSQISNERFQFLMDNDVIQINKRANFNLEKFNELKNTKIFSEFDEIKSEDFKDISKNYNRLIEKLTMSYDDQKLLFNRGPNTLGLNIENINFIGFEHASDLLGDDFVFFEGIQKLINKKFAFRIALERLAAKIHENVENETRSQDVIIQLEINPHLDVLNSLLANDIIEHAKADKDKMDNVDKIKNKLNSMNVNLGYLSSGITTTSTLNFLSRIPIIIKDDLKNIKDKVKGLIQALSNLDIENPDVVLKSLEEVAEKSKYREFVEFMRLKGFDMVIKIEQKKYSSTYWFRFAMVMLIALAQIVIGAVIMVLTSGIAYKIGEAVLQEGIGDAIFALGTLTSGHFTWKDYGEYKMWSVITTVTMFGLQSIFAKIKYVKKFFPPSPQINQNILSTLKSNTSVFKLLKSGGQIAKGTRKMAFQLFRRQVMSSVGKAFVQAAIGMGADFIIQNLLDQPVKKISKFIIDNMQDNFWTHDLSKTIDKLSEFYSLDDAKQIIFREFGKISSDHTYYTDITEKISNKIDDLIKTGEGISKKITVPMTLIAKLAEMTSVTLFAGLIFQWLNNALNNVLEKKIEKDKIDPSLKPKDDDVKKFKESILEHIKTESTEKFKRGINSTVVKPAISFAANSVVNKVKNEFKKVVQKSKEKAYRKSVEDIVEVAQKKDLTEYDMKKIQKVLTHTKSPELYATLTKLDIPMNSVGIEAAAIVLKDHLNVGHKIEVEYEGRKFVFGDVDNENAKIVGLKLNNGHFENSKNSQYGYDCMYNALADQIPELNAKLSPKEFRNKTAETMVGNKQIIKEIYDSKKKYFMYIGFYGGGGQGNPKKIPVEGEEPELPDQGQGHFFKLRSRAIPKIFDAPKNEKYKNLDDFKNDLVSGQIEFPATPRFAYRIGSFERLDDDFKGMRQYIAEVDHIPPKSTYTMDFRKDDEKGNNLPCIVVPYLFHRMLNSTFNNDFRELQTTFIKNGNRAAAIAMSLYDYQHKAVEYREMMNERKVTNKYLQYLDAEYSTNGFTSNIKHMLEEYVEDISTNTYGTNKKTLISRSERDKLINIINRFPDNHQKITIDFQDGLLAGVDREIFNKQMNYETTIKMPETVRSSDDDAMDIDYHE